MDLEHNRTNLGLHYNLHRSGEGVMGWYKGAVLGWKWTAVHQLKSELAECKQRGMTILSYYGKLKLIGEELVNYEQYPICGCGECTCDLKAKLNKKREEERLHQFLMGLDDIVYGCVRSNILSTDPLPPLNRAYSLIVQQERAQTITRGKKDVENQWRLWFKEEWKGKQRTEKNLVQSVHIAEK